MQVSLIVFDMAGTTVTDKGAVAQAFVQAFKDLNHTVAVTEVNPLMGYKKNEAIRIILERLEVADITPALIDDIHSRFVNHMLNYYRTSPDIQALPEAETVMQHLKSKGIQVGLDTGFSKDIADVIVDRLGWKQKGLIDYVVASDEVPAGRPHPYMIRKMMEAAGITDPLQVVKVGDTEVDINEGKNAGCRYSIGVTTGAFTREELMPYEPSHIIDNLQELLPILEPNYV
jgi:phosphonatase-like hydrolase